MSILTELEIFINEASNIYEEFNIDTIRVEYSKQHKKSKLDDLGRWKKINANDKRIFAKLKKRLMVDEVTSAYQLDNHNIYYYNSSTPPKYNKATMVIFGLKQYHKEPPPRGLIDNILNILTFGTSKLNINIDVCIDLSDKPNLDKLKYHYNVVPCYIKGYKTDTSYINEPNITMVEKIIFYNKQFKNDLDFPLWRVEAKIEIPNRKNLSLAYPLYEFEGIIKLIKHNKALHIAKEII